MEFLLLGVLVGVMLFVTAKQKEQGKQKEVQKSPTTPTKTVYALKIPDTQDAQHFKPYLHSFGLKPTQALDLKVYPGPANELPDALQALVEECHQQGDTRGWELPALMIKKLKLAADHGVYFALMRNDPERPVIVSFIDRLRHKPA